MRFVKMAPVNDQVAEMEQLYGTFDIGLDGLPNAVWEGRNIKKWKPPGEMFQHAYLPEMYLNRIRVNRRIFGPLSHVYEEICVRWTQEARRANGLTQFVKCYCFGDVTGPNLFWYGGAWELSPQLGGEMLGEVIKVFTRHGFTHAFTTDKRKVRILEYW